MNSSGSSTWLIKCEVCILKITLLFFPTISQPSCFFVCSFFTFITSHALLFSSLSALPTLLSIIHHLTGDPAHFLQFSLQDYSHMSEYSFQELLIPTKSWRVSRLIPTSNHTHRSCKETSTPLDCSLMHPTPELWRNHSSRVPCAYEDQQEDLCPAGQVLLC